MDLTTGFLRVVEKDPVGHNMRFALGEVVKFAECDERVTVSYARGDAEDEYEGDEYCD